MRAPSIGTLRFFAAARPMTNTPRPVASRRPRLPPSEIGLPVTTPVDVRPWLTENVSIIHAMIRSSVLTSGAGMSLSGPITKPISLV